MQANPFRAFMTQWNVVRPIDRWWREKYKIPFNSPEHRIASLIAMRYEFEEDELYAELRKADVPAPAVVEAYQTYHLTGQYLTGSPMAKITATELDSFFDQLTDLSQFNDPEPDTPPGVSFDD